MYLYVLLSHPTHLSNLQLLVSGQNNINKSPGEMWDQLILSSDLHFLQDKKVVFPRPLSTEDRTRHRLRQKNVFATNNQHLLNSSYKGINNLILMLLLLCQSQYNEFNERLNYRKLSVHKTVRKKRTTHPADSLVNELWTNGFQKSRTCSAL